MFKNKKSLTVSFNAFAQTKPIIVIARAYKPLGDSIKNLYNWTIRFAKTKYATQALSGLSFAEASFFPIPVDPLMMALIFAKPKKWIFYTVLTTVSSVLGGLFGYAIGALLFDSIGNTIIEALHLQENFDNVSNLYTSYGVAIVIIAGFTPLPFKLFTITAGVFRLALPQFFIASMIGRSLRFGLVGSFAAYLGAKHKDKIEKYVDIISILLLLLLVIAFLIYRALN